MKVRALIKEPGKPAEERYIEDSIKDIKAIVGPMVRESYLGEDIVFYCNDPLEQRGESNFFLYYSRQSVELIFGTALFLRIDEEGDYIDLTMSDINRLKNFLELEAMTPLGGHFRLINRKVQS